MPAYGESDFEKMAEDVVRGFMDQGEKLAESAARCAKQARLNPDQIERLAQTTNNLAFLRLMDRSKSAGARDLTQEFEPVESAMIIRIIIGKAAPAPEGNAPKSTAMETDTIPNEMASVRAPAEKAAGAPIEMPIDEIGDRRRAQQTEFHNTSRLRKLADHLHHERLAVEHTFDEKIAELCRRMRRIDAPSLEDFEKNAMAIRGDDLAMGVINLVRASFGASPREALSAEKLAHLQDHHLAPASEELRLFENLVADAELGLRLEEGSTWIRQRLH